MVQVCVYSSCPGFIKICHHFLPSDLDPLTLWGYWGRKRTTAIPAFCAWLVWGQCNGDISIFEKVTQEGTNSLDSYQYNSSHLCQYVLHYVVCTFGCMLGTVWLVSWCCAIKRHQNETSLTFQPQVSKAIGMVFHKHSLFFQIWNNNILRDSYMGKHLFISADECTRQVQSVGLVGRGREGDQAKAGKLTVEITQTKTLTSI